MAMGAVLPWPGLVTALAYTTSTSSMVMSSSQPKMLDLVTPALGPKQPGALPSPNSLWAMCRPGMRAA